MPDELFAGGTCPRRHSRRAAPWRQLAGPPANPAPAPYCPSARRVGHSTLLLAGSGVYAVVSAGAPARQQKRWASPPPSRPGPRAGPRAHHVDPPRSTRHGRRDRGPPGSNPSATITLIVPDGVGSDAALASRPGAWLQPEGFTPSPWSRPPPQQPGRGERPTQCRRRSGPGTHDGLASRQRPRVKAFTRLQQLFKLPLQRAPAFAIVMIGATRPSHGCVPLFEHAQPGRRGVGVGVLSMPFCFRASFAGQNRRRASGSPAARPHRLGAFGR